MVSSVFCSTGGVLGTVLSNYLMLSITLQRNCYYFHFTDEETEAQTGYLVWPRSDREKVVNTGCFRKGYERGTLVPVSWGCHNKGPQTSGIKSRNVCSHSPGG